MPSTNTSVTAGCFITSRLQLAHSSNQRKWGVVAAASREESDDRYELINDNATPLNSTVDRLEKRNNAQFKKISAFSRVGYQWSNDIRSNVLLQATGRNLGAPEWLNKEKTKRHTTLMHWSSKWLTGSMALATGIHH